MKTYISGKITGLPFNEVKEKFEGAEDLLTDLDMTPINPLKNGLTQQHSWDEHMVRDIEMLLKCDAILMLTGWEYSNGALIENYIAKRTGKVILYENVFTEKQKHVMKVRDAIRKATGLEFTDYTTKCRKKDVFFARMLFAKQCHGRLNHSEIAELINRDRTTVVHLLKTYNKEVKYNSYFRKMSRRVDDAMSVEFISIDVVKK